MYISEIIIDGFKSYASRTVLSGFDQSFNAITGLNGSGKSNILDAICFVLGISNLNQVRVTNLQELVFKQGQAGVTKASVTIVFNNADRTRSPPGYEEYSQITVARQVVIGGRNKYLINGHTAQLNRVQNLFHSVQLNVNNPHFLIMQGRITKVLNMKPPEILGMIEEAAGTRMYEMRKSNAHKTMQKKDKKLEEIEKMLEEEIVPTLNRLKVDREKYVKWSSLGDECESLEKYCLAFQYHEYSEKSKSLEDEIKSSSKKLNSLQEQVKEAENEEKEVTKQIDSLKKSKKGKSTSGTESSELDAELAQLNKDLAKLTASTENKRKEIENERKKVESLTTQIESCKKQVETRKSQQESTKVQLQSVQTESEQLERRLVTLRERSESVAAGVAVSLTDDGTITERLMERKRIQAELSTQSEKLRMRSEHITATLEKNKTQLSKLAKQDEELKKVIQKKQSELESIQNKRDALHFDPKHYEQVTKQITHKQSELNAGLQERIQTLTAQVARYYFEYNKSAVKQDRVMGLVAQLLSVKDPSKTCVALEVAAGSKLYHVVVDDENTARSLIQDGKPNRRITVIPLNKVRYNEFHPNTIKSAEKYGAKPALVLVEYDQSIAPAIKYTFGKTLICNDLDQAEKVAFDPQILCRTVTLDGDVFDPSGTLTGGSRGQLKTESTLQKITELSQLQSQFDSEMEQLNALQKSIDANRMNTFMEFNSECDLKMHELNLIKSRSEQSSHSMLLKQIQELQNELDSIANVQLPNCRAQESDNEQVLRSLEEQAAQESTIVTTQKQRQEQVKKIESEYEQVKSLLKSKKTQLRESQQSFEKSNLQMEQDLLEITECESKIFKCKDQINKYDLELSQLESKSSTCRSNQQSIQSKIDQDLQEKDRLDQERSELRSQRELLAKRSTDLSVQYNLMDRNHKQLQERLEKAILLSDQIRQQHAWVKSNHHPYDFTKETLQQALDKLTNAQQERGKTGRSVNKKAMAMYDKAEKEYNDLISKRGIVESDKQKIEQVIVELDDKKRVAIQKTWSKVNGDFASIFSTLLPGAKSKLNVWKNEKSNDDRDDDDDDDEDMDRQVVVGEIEGLEVKVGFGHVWKQSLTELSGGQRSLLALSLILALLSFKPAPMYILDEIDAALDPSHTQNIGRMLKSHFAHSQFIVVSLKEGMFQNANVLFRTKYVNGQSTVSRVMGHKSVMSGGGGEDDDDKENENANTTNVKSSSSRSKKRARAE
ncbi:structural maintenance of chromosome [Acrasis kona]|uniref:Structural maintenance of chromosomes protein n=1 Tax=Acrasis kona TaxID=1008807 RepID=A0AAW2YSX4_9EUKA